MVVHGGRHLETVGMTPKQRHSNMAADRGEPPSAHGRHPPVRGVAHRQSAAVSRKRAVDRPTADRETVMAVDLPEAWHPPESQKGLSKRLSALGGKRTRVRRESPSKTPKNGFWRVS